MSIAEKGTWRICAWMESILHKKWREDLPVGVFQYPSQLVWVLWR